MESIITIVSFIFIIGLIVTPVIIIWRLKKQNKKLSLLLYLALGVLTTTALTFVFAWWADISDKILLAHYGYNIDGMNETEFYGQVAPENMKKVKELVTSISGIGWPLKAMMTFVFYLPYLFIIYLISYLIERRRKAYS
ncbi:MAG: hypothetical protein K2X48_11595 [Chitinophagaceae bacterium]|nr:hypothetical protein [Chitinophagaceae bacterium]